MNANLYAVSSPSPNERIAACLAHAGTLVAWTIAPLCVYLIKRGESRFVEYHALQSLLWSLAGTLISLATCGLAIPVFMVFHVLAAIKAAHGETFDYPIVSDIAKRLL